MEGVEAMGKQEQTPLVAMEEPVHLPVNME
jgi:hypothetical protein